MAKPKAKGKSKGKKGNQKKALKKKVASKGRTKSASKKKAVAKKNIARRPKVSHVETAPTVTTREPTAEISSPEVTQEPTITSEGEFASTDGNGGNTV